MFCSQSPSSKMDGEMVQSCFRYSGKKEMQDFHHNDQQTESLNCLNLMM